MTAEMSSADDSEWTLSSRAWRNACMCNSLTNVWSNSEMGSLFRRVGLAAREEEALLEFEGDVSRW